MKISLPILFPNMVMNLYSIYQRLFLRARMRIAGLALPNPLHNTHVHNTKLQAHPVAMIICLFASWRFCWSMHNALQTCTCARVYGYNACQLVVHLVRKQTAAHLWHSQKPVIFGLTCSSCHVLSVLHMYKNELVWPLETCVSFHLLSLLWLDLFASSVAVNCTNVFTTRIADEVYHSIHLSVYSHSIQYRGHL